MKRPLVGFILIFISGMLLGKVLAFSAWELLLVATLIFLFSVLTVIGRGINLYFLPLFLFLGLFWHQIAIDSYQPIEERYLNQQLLLQGTIIKEPEIKASHLQYYLELDSVFIAGKENPLQATIVVKDYEAEKSFSYGDMVKIKGKINLPKLPANPGEFNYFQYLERQGVGGVLNLWQSRGIEKVGLGRVNALVGTSLKVKDRMALVAKRTLSETHAGLLLGIAFGAKGQIGEETLEVFRQTGVAHILAVSGLHVGIILAGVMLLGNLLGLTKRKAAIFSAIGIVLYALMTGFTPSVLRATIMALFLLFGIFIDKQRDWPTSLALSAFIILIINPLSLWEIGFQLSYAATWSILYFTPLLNKLLNWKNASLKNTVTVPLAAQLGTWPLIAHYFNVFSLVSILANLLLVQIVTAVLLLGLLASVVGIFIMPLAEILNVTTGLLLDLLVAITLILHKLPGAFWFVKSPPLWLILLWYLGLFLVGYYFYNPSFKRTLQVINLRHKGKVITLNSLLLIFIVWSGIGGLGTEPLTVTFLDVGQGDSAVIYTPSGKTMVIDAGGSPEYMEKAFDPGLKIVAPFLQRQGLNNIDVLVLTHPHEDHIGGALALLNRFKVGLVVISPVKGKSKAYQQILKTLEEKEVPVVIGEMGDVIDLDQVVQFLILHPDNQFRKASADLNNNSVVVKLLHGRKGFLFTGDVEKEGIKEMLKQQPRQLRADVLKAPHHGSRTSLVSQFYQKVDPEFVVISVGDGNRYGHPHQETVKALREYGASIYRTDKQGAVTFRSNGEILEIESQKGVGP